ncbi:MAG: beta-ketoacyl synthase chain length factor [Treponema sp.]|nr:beta-ketoacyl synthase chain length factor [Treponema sp.]
MKHNEIYISRFSAWAPGMENAKEWEEWAAGRREMSCASESPKIEFTDSMFRRRLSQISKMTIQVVHDILPVKKETKMIFLSFRGELSRQFKINKMQIESGSFLPAAFSFSVFNAPAALASMALDLKGGYTAVYPINNSIKAGLIAAAAMLNTGTADELVLVYADEEVPEEYSCFVTEPLPPFAFSLLLSRKPCSDFIYSMDKNEICPRDFLKELYLKLFQ